MTPFTLSKSGLLLDRLKRLRVDALFLQLAVSDAIQFFDEITASEISEGLQFLSRCGFYVDRCGAHSKSSENSNCDVGNILPVLIRSRKNLRKIRDHSELRKVREGMTIAYMAKISSKTSRYIWIP